MATAPARTQRGVDTIFVALTRDGRLANETTLERLAGEASTATDCFVFCHGWLYDEGEARQEAARFFALLETAMAPLRERVVPLRVALHWPSKPFSRAAVMRARIDEGLWPALLARRSRPGLRDLLLDLCAAEIAEAPEEDVELEFLAKRLRSGRALAADRGGASLLPLHALSFWVMKRRAGQVGERFGREFLAPLWAGLPRAPRLHLVGHSFGAKLATSMVLGGVRPRSLTLLLAAFSAFAFAPKVPGTRRPGFYHRVLAERLVERPIVVLRSVHDRAISVLYAAVTGAGQVDRGPRGRGRGDGKEEPVGDEAYAGNADSKPGRLGHSAAKVAASGLGAVGARGVGAPELDLLDILRTGLPQYPIVNVDGSRVINADEPLVGAHRDIAHSEVATLVLLAAGLLAAGPNGVRPRRVCPLEPA